MNDIKQRIDTGALFTGAVLIGIGTLFLLDRLHIASFHRLIRDYWPMMFIAIGVSNLFGKHFWGGIWFITIGVWFEIGNLHLFGLDYSSSWPLLLIVFGASMVARTLVAASRRGEVAAPEEEHHDA
jgi:hypothetical protein